LNGTVLGSSWLELQSLNMYILGISSMSHDSAAALLGDSGIVAAIEEGKLARTRMIGGVPRAAIQFCLERAGIAWRDVQHLAVAGQPSESPEGLAIELSNIRTLKQMAGSSADRVQTFDHHLCHAASAFYASPYERALIVTLDEGGEGRSGIVAIGEGNHIQEIESVHFPHSLGRVYSKVTRLLGWRAHGDEHKTQWLSLVGEAEFEIEFTAMLRQKAGGPPHLDDKYFRRDRGGEFSFSDNFYRAIGSAVQSNDQAAVNFGDSKRANIAASLQKAVGNIVCDWLTSLRSKNQENSLCLAGGLFLNPLLVAEIETRAGFENVFVQPAAGNEGTALGAAWLASRELASGPSQRSIATAVPFWGPAYSNAQIKFVLDNCKATYRWLDSDDLKLAETLKLLNTGKILALFQREVEFGPRALGDRSLLASPWAPYVKENLNDFVKHRESFRPFALAIPEEDCADFFQVSSNARFMTTMAKANEAGRALLKGLPEGFLLRDDLVRLQVVRESDNPFFWRLLKRFGENAPAPILVNTSFNLFGEPLVVTPRDAIRSYFCSGTDAMVVGNFLLVKR
jgi:carbamoyltransferase